MESPKRVGLWAAGLEMDSGPGVDLKREMLFSKKINYGLTAFV